MIEVGKTYYVRTTTDHWVGKLREVAGPFTVVLENASWVADSGRLSEFMAHGKAGGMEVEPVGTIMVRWDAILAWPHKLFDKAV